MNQSLPINSFTKANPHRLYSLKLSVLLAALLVFNLGCTKKEEPKGIAPFPLFAVLPSDTNSFYAFRTDTFSQTAQEKSGPQLSFIENSLSKFASAESIRKLFNDKAIEKEILFGIVGSAGGAETDRVVAAITTNSTPGNELLPKLNDLLKQQGFGVEPGKPTLFTGAKDKTVLISSSKPELEKMLLALEAKEPSFITKNLPNQETQINTVGNFGVGRLAQNDIFRTLFEYSKGGVVELGEKENFPVDTVLFLQSLAPNSKGSSKVQSKALLKLSPKNANQIQLIKNLGRPDQSLIPLDSQGAHDTAFRLLFSQTLLDTIRQGALAELSTEQKKSLPITFESLASVELGGLAPAKDMVFPDLYLFLASPSSSVLSDQVKKALHDAISSQIPESAWLDKEVEGIRMQYVNSPIGLGIYTATGKNGVYVTTSEGALKAIFKQREGSSMLMSADATSEPLLVAGSIDFNKIATIAEELQGSFAMFTGGAQYLSNEQLVALKAIGQARYGIRIAGQDLEITWNQDAS